MTFDEFIRIFHINLTDQQLAAVQSIEDPTLLLAVPGSGKTTVLVTRLGYMIYCCGIDPRQILTVTYTVAATQDMRSRFGAIFGETLAGQLEFRTINGICSKIIADYARKIRKKPFDLLTDEGKKTKLLADLYLQLVKAYPTENELKQISTMITYIKNMQLGERDIKKMEKESDWPVFALYRAYCETMREQSCMDYDDQMIYALTILRKVPGMLSLMQDRYRYICVDEAQDTSKIQYEILALLAGRYGHLFLVGDEDQSIYGFRAAYPDALLSFERQFHRAKVLLMEENFRSNANIVAAADQFIQKNQLRHQKHMRAARESGSRIWQIPLKSRKAQYTYLAKVATDCAEQTAVLYRDNESILPVVDLLERQGIAYRMKSADLTFFSHRIVKDIEQIIWFAAHGKDTETFLQIYYKMGMYLSKQAAMEACQYSIQKNIPILQAALTYVDLPLPTSRSVKSIQTHLHVLRSDKADKAVYRIVHFMGYGEYLKRMQIKSDKIAILEAIGAQEPNPDRLVERLRELSHLIREPKTDAEGTIIFSTIHSSKGLEYDTVYLMDVKDGVFPEVVLKDRQGATVEEIKTYEEERRLFYVAVTRAKNHLRVFGFEQEATFTKELLDKKRTTLVGRYGGVMGGQNH